jgi:hypothetical protein
MWDSQPMAEQLSRDAILHVRATVRYVFYGCPSDSQPPTRIRKSMAQQRKYTTLVCLGTVNKDYTKL